MTPYVELQQDIIRWLFALLSKKDPADMDFLRELLSRCREPGFKLGDDWASRLCGYVLPEGIPGCDIKGDFVEIIVQQLDDSGPELVVRNLLGWELQPSGASCYDLVGWVRERGRGHNMLRTPDCAQPRALRVGDIFITGERVISPPREGGNGIVLVHLSSHLPQGAWFDFPSRIALALFPSVDDAPPGLIEN